MRKSWCYLMTPEGDPLLLAPCVGAAVPAERARLHVGLAARLVLGPQDAKVELRGLPSGEPLQLTLPWTPAIAELHQAITAAR
jgi:hypothetical protein